MAGDPNCSYWWGKPITHEEVKKLIETVKQGQQSGKGYAGITMNRIEIALQTLDEMMDNQTKDANNA